MAVSNDIRIESTLARDGTIRDFEISILRTAAGIKVLNTLSVEYSIPLVDFVPMTDREPELFVSYVHLSPTGNRRLSDALYESFARERIGCGGGSGVSTRP